MFARNYTDIVRTIISDDDWGQFEIQSDQQVLPTIVPCEYGWNYDRRAFPNTVVMEVKYALITLITNNRLTYLI